MEAVPAQQTLKTVLHPERSEGSHSDLNQQQPNVIPSAARDLTIIVSRLEWREGKSSNHNPYLSPMSDLVGTFAGILTALFLVPQLIKMIRAKKAGDISIPMFVILLLAQILWVIYGVLKNDLPLIITNSVTLALNITILALTIRFRKSN
jgi:MtN3 and saliva related transmembrane protein